MIFNIDYRINEQKGNTHKWREINRLRDSSVGSLQMRSIWRPERAAGIHNHEVPSSILGPATNLKGSFRGTYEEIRKCFFRIIFGLGNTEGTQTILFFSFLYAKTFRS